LWRRPVAGGYSEIAVAGGHAITMELRAGADFVVALDPATGREQWSTRVGPTFKGHDGSDDGPIATPAIDGAEVFAIGPHGHLIALDVATGHVRWRHDLVAEFGAAVPAYGFAASPLVEGDLVIVPTGGPNSRGLLAFNRTSGRLMWNASHAKTLAYSSAVAAVIGGVRQIVAGAGDRIFAVSPVDGRLLWSVAGLGAGKDLATSPIALPGDRVLYSSWDETVMLKVTRDGDAQSARELWRSPRLRAYNGPTIYRDGFLYGVAGPQLVCLDAETAAIKWRERTGEGTLVALGSHMLLLGQTSGDLRLVRASPDGYSESLRTRVFAPDVISATGPTVAGGRIYIRNLREMAAFSLF
jgi:outer membrane protein assembly factor BamB